MQQLMGQGAADLMDPAAFVGLRYNMDFVYSLDWSVHGKGIDRGWFPDEKYLSDEALAPSLEDCFIDKMGKLLHSIETDEDSDNEAFSDISKD
ncbi:hypothetical protein TWF706_009469 [Orbilia oligospora]|nr:hypothetical protein TWF706_009469 [Orbilia oligospora]